MISRRVPFARRMASLLFAASTLGLVAGCGLTDVRRPSWFSATPTPPDLATAQMRQLTDGEKAEVCLATAVSLAAGDAEPAAIDQFERARKFGGDPDGAIGRRLAVLYDRQGKVDAAEREYSAALARFPQDADLNCDYGYFLYSRGDLEQAEVSLRKAIELSPKHPKATINLAMTLVELRRYDEAEALFEQAVGKAAAQHNLGVALARHGQFDESRRRLELAARLDPSLSTSALRWIDERTQVADAGRSAGELR